MLLALHSDQLDNRQDIDRRLVQLLAKDRPRFAFVPSASDTTRRYFADRRTYYAKLGVDLAEYCDLGDEYDELAIERAFGCDAIHLSGGNTFAFLAAIHHRNLGPRLTKYAGGGGALVGVSAGAILMTPTILTASICGDQDHWSTEDASGLGLVRFDFIPHVSRIGDPQRVVSEYATQHPDRLVVGCSDGEGVLINGNRTEFFGNLTIGLGSTCTCPFEISHGRSQQA